MVVAGPVGAISAGATYGAVEHGPEGIPGGAIRGAIYAALAPTAGEALGVNPEGIGGTITGLNGPSLLNQLGVSSAPAIGGGIGLFGNLGEVGLVEQTLAPTIQITSSTTAPIVATSTTTAQSINLALTAAEAISSAAPVIGYSYANQLTESRTAISALQSEQRKKRRREFYRSVVGMGFGAFVASVSAPFLLAGQSSFVIALGEGAIFGGIASGISRRNAAQGAFEGAFFAGLGNIIDSGLSHSKYLSEAKRLREALGAAASSTVYIVVHNGKLEDVLIGAGSSALSNFLVPLVTGSVNEEILRVFVTGTVTSLMHRTELAQSLVAAGLGSVQSRIQRLARQYGHGISMNQQVRRRPKSITNDGAEERKPSKPKAQEDTWRSNSLNVATQKASEVLASKNIQVSEKRVRRVFEKEPILQGSKEDIQKNLIALGRADGPIRDNRSAFERGLEKVFLAILNGLVGEAHAGELDFVHKSKAHQPTMKKDGEKQPSIFERRAGLDRQINGGSHLRESDEATIFLAAMTKVGANAIEGMVGLGKFIADAFLSTETAGVFFPEAQSKALERHTGRLRTTVYAVVNYEDTAHQISEGLKRKFEQAARNYEQGRYFDSGRDLGDIGSVVAPIGPLGFGAAKLTYNLSKMAVKSGPRGIFTLFDTNREVAHARFVRTHHSDLFPEVVLVERTLNGKQKYVSTGGFRNESPLTYIQKQEAFDYAKRLGMPEQSIIFSDNMNTSYKLLFGEERLYIGTDVLPTNSSLSKANSRVTMKGAIAHEIIGHRAAELSGMSHANLILEEAQASIRAARFAPELSNTERLILLRDAVERLRGSGYKIREVKGELWIENMLDQQPKLKGF